MAKKKKGKKKFVWLKWLFKLAAFGILLLALFIGAIYLGFFGALPSQEDLAKIQQENASLIYSADDVLIGKIFAKNRTQVDSADMPEYLLDALVATEDKRFYDHEGVDYRSYVRVLLRTIILRDEAGGGGSTITQQLAKNLFGRPDYGLLSMPIAKIKEAILARRLEENYTKNQLLVLYFNTVPFGENTWGIEAASRRYFNRPVKDVSVPQAALLVGMLKANSTFNPRLHPEAATGRRNTVLTLMQQQNYLTAEDAEQYRKSPLNLDYANYALYNPSGHFVYKVSQKAREIIAALNQKNGTDWDLEKDGFQIETTLNYQLQKMAVAATKKQLEAKQPILRKQLKQSGAQAKFYRANKSLAQDTTKKVRHVFQWDEDNLQELTAIDSAWHNHSMLHAGAMAMHPKTGEVLVWVGGNNFRYTPFDLVTSKRQSASAFKPILYAAAVQQGKNPCDYFDNEARVYKEYDDWKPQNYSGKGEGEVAMWYALSKSLNVPTVDLYMHTGYDQLRITASDLGLNLPTQEAPAVSLGTESFSIQEMVAAYATFANNGVRKAPVIIKTIKDAEGNVIYKAPRSRGKRAVSPITAQVITRMLMTAVEEGTGSSMKSTFGVDATLAGKTGTSQNYTDAWFISFTEEIAFGVWVGAMDPAVHFTSGFYGSGSKLALPVAAYFYNKMEKQKKFRQQYLTGFPSMPAVQENFGCAGWREKGLFNRMFNNVFEGNQRGVPKKHPRHQPEEEEKEGFLKRKWKKVFKKK